MSHFSCVLKAHNNANNNAIIGSFYLQFHFGVTFKFPVDGGLKFLLALRVTLADKGLTVGGSPYLARALRFMSLSFFCAFSSMLSFTSCLLLEALVDNLLLSWPLLKGVRNTKSSVCFDVFGVSFGVIWERNTNLTYIGCQRCYCAANFKGGLST